MISLDAKNCNTPPPDPLPENAKEGGANVLFLQGGANRTARSPPKGPKPEEKISKGGHLK